MSARSIGATSAAGTLWAGRYRAAVVDSQGQVLTVLRLIEQAPLR